MDGMTVSDLEVLVAKQLVKAKEVAKVLDKTPGKGLNTYMLRNLWAICHASSHVLQRGLGKMVQELSSKPVGDQGALFDTPEDHAMTVAEIEEWIEGFKGVIIGDYIRDDTGRGDFQGGPAGGVAGRIKAAIAAQGETGLTWSEVGVMFDGQSHETFGADVVEMCLWAMVHTGELAEGEDDHLIAESPDLQFDILAMLESQRALGTEVGIDGESVKLVPIEGGEVEPPDLVDVVSVRIFAGDGATIDSMVDALVEDGDDRVAVDNAVTEAVDWLVEQRKIELAEGSDDLYVPFGQDLDSLHGDTLRSVYERETGEKAGRKGEPRMRDEIGKVRAAKAEEAGEGDDEPEATDDTEGDAGDGE